MIPDRLEGKREKTKDDQRDHAVGLAERHVYI